MKAFFRWLGRLFVSPVVSLGRVGVYAASISSKLFSREWSASLLVDEMMEIGVHSAPMLIVVSLFAGMIASVDIVDTFIKFGAEKYIGGVISLSMMRELSPVLCGLLVAGRVGSAMAAEIGTMKITEQLDALMAFGIDPVGYIGVPKVVAGVVMLPLLNIFSVSMSLVGAYIVIVLYSGIPSGLFHYSVIDFIELKDITGSFVKAVVFGFIVSVVSCSEGFSTTGGARGVGRTTTMSVVLSINLILLSDYVLSTIFWGGGPYST